jgi:high-affinity Fe2+/Pb2+ permease
MYFFTGYFFSTVMIGFLFRNRDYPMKEIILYVSAGMLVLALILILTIDRARKRPVTENSIKILLMLVLTVLAALM